MSEVKYYEVEFTNDWAIAIKGVRKPTPEEAQKFTGEDPAKYKAVDVREISFKEVLNFFDASRIDKWPVFGLDNPEQRNPEDENKRLRDMLETLAHSVFDVLGELENMDTDWLFRTACKAQDALDGKDAAAMGICGRKRDRDLRLPWSVKEQKDWPTACLASVVNAKGVTVAYHILPEEARLIAESVNEVETARRMASELVHERRHLVDLVKRLAVAMVCLADGTDAHEPPFVSKRRYIEQLYGESKTVVERDGGRLGVVLQGDPFGEDKPKSDAEREAVRAVAKERRKRAFEEGRAKLKETETKGSKK